MLACCRCIPVMNDSMNKDWHFGKAYGWWRRLRKKKSMYMGYGWWFGIGNCQGDGRTSHSVFAPRLLPVRATSWPWWCWLRLCFCTVVRVCWKLENTKAMNNNNETTTGLLLLRRSRILLSYPELAHRAWGPTGESLVKTSIALMQSGICLTYLIFVPQNFHTSILVLTGLDISPLLSSWLAFRFHFCGFETFVKIDTHQSTGQLLDSIWLDNLFGFCCSRVHVARIRYGARPWNMASSKSSAALCPRLVSLCWDQCKYIMVNVLWILPSILWLSYFALLFNNHERFCCLKAPLHC